MSTEKTASSPREISQDRDGRLWWVVILPLLAATLGSLLTVIAWSSQLPSEVANQWAWGEGTVTTVRPLWVTVVLLTLLAIAFIVGILILEGTQRLTRWGRRLTTGALAGIAAVLAAAPPVLLAGQRGIESGWAAPDPGPGMAWLAIVAALYAVAAALLIGNRPLTGETVAPGTVEHLGLADGEDAIWVRTTTAWVFVLLGVTGIVVTLVGVLVERLWPLTLLGAVFLVLGVLASRWTIIVDRAGVRCASFLGLARFSYPVLLDATAEVTHIRGIAEFLGWGIRIGGEKSVGLIFRNGPALRVHIPGGRSLTVTVEDAATGAALYNTQTTRLRTTTPDENLRPDGI